MTGVQLGWAGLIVALISLALAVFFYLKGRKPKRLAYQSLDIDPSLPRDVPGWESFAVTFDNKPVKHVRFAQVFVQNTGKVEIRRDDFDQLIAVNVTGDTTIVTQRLSLMTLNHMDIRPIEPVEHSPRRCVAPAVLLNPGDSIEFFFLLDGKEPMQYSVSGRLAGAELRRLTTDASFPDMSLPSNRPAWVNPLAGAAVGLTLGLLGTSGRWIN